MSKPRLISNKPLTLHSNWLVPLVSQYFDLVVSEGDPTLTSSDCWYTNYWDATSKNLAQSGKKIVIDQLWEPASQSRNPYPCHVLQNWNWLWYQESLWYRYLDYHSYVPHRAWQYRALLPMRRVRKSRDYIVTYLGQRIDEFLWSYQDKGRHLPNGGDPNDWGSQRLFQPDWYNQCAMSLVAETAAENNSCKTPLVSEKTFKPLAFYHPFVVCGDSNTLNYLQSLGFETFSNLFDESYDTITNWQHRCGAAMNQCLSAQFDGDCYDSVTKAKLLHNHNHFFDQSLVERKITTEILEPLLHYAQT